MSDPKEDGQMMLEEMRETEKSADAAPPLDQSHPITKQTSTGTWGEEQRGEPIDVDQARAEFELARQSSRKSQQNITNGGILSGGRKLANTLSRGNKQQQQPQDNGGNMAVMEEGIDENYHETSQQLRDDEFDLAKFIKARYYKLNQADIDYSKHVGVSWKELKVSAPGRTSNINIL